MANRDELVSAMNALPQTLSFTSVANGSTSLPGGATRHTYAWRKDLGEDRTRTETVLIVEEADLSARFEGQNPTATQAPARVTPAQVLSFYPNAENINITRSNESFDEVRFDDYDNVAKQALKRLVRVKFSGAGAYEKHYEVTNEYEQVV